MTKHQSSKSTFTASELLAVNAARLMTDGQTVFAGIGVPLLAATLAQHHFCPHLTILFEGGVIGPRIVPGELPRPPTSSAARAMRRWCSRLRTFYCFSKRGYVDLGFMGGAQIDRYGNLNSSFIGGPKACKVRLPGTGGGNDISSLTNMIVAMKHEKRRFVEKVDFITSPGWIRGGDSRARSGLPQGGMWRVVTDLAVMGFHEETREMQVIAMQAGVTREQIQDNTGFKLRFADKVEIAEPPRKEELATLHHLDPERRFTS